MDLGVHVASVLFDELESVTRVTVHVMVPIGSSTVGEEDQNLMNRLGVLGQVILFERTPFVSGIPEDDKTLTYPERISIFQVGLRVPLLGMNESGELCRIP